MIARTYPLELTRRLRYPTQLAAIAIAYVGAAKLGLVAAVAQKVVSSAWPPSGVALATLLLLGPRYWPGIAVGAFLLNWTAGVPVAAGAGIALRNTLEAVCAVWLLRRLVAFRPSLDRLRDVVGLVNLAALVRTCRGRASGTGLRLAGRMAGRGAAEGAAGVSGAALRDQEALLRATFEQAAVGIAVAGLDARVARTNQVFQRMLGYADAEL